MDIQNSLKTIQQCKRTLTRIEKNIKSYNKIEKTTLDNIAQAEKLLTKIQKDAAKLHNKELFTELQAFISSESQENNELNIQLQRMFGSELNNELKNNNLILEGRLPKIRVGYYGLDISFSKNQCKIYYGVNEELILNIKLDPKKIVKEIIEFENKLENNKLDTSLFIKSYHTVLSSHRRESINRVPIIKLLNQVTMDLQSTKFAIDPTRKNYREYSRVQFSHDLYKLKRDKVLRLSLVTANRGQVRNKLDYLWVPTSPSKGSVYSSVEIMEET